MKKISFAIIGGGPAGFYTAKLLAKLPCSPIIHLIQKQLCPFGLIRYGVAPDHISIKKSQMTLSQAQNYQNFKYIGNCTVTKENLKDLSDAYSGLIFSYGATGNSIPQFLSQNIKQIQKGQLQNVKTARDIVFWYNGHPKYQNNTMNLENIRNVSIIGNGNVSIDIARIFLRQPKQLIQSQINIKAYQQLLQSKIINIQIIGRRGVVQSAFALKQLRQLTKQNISLYAIKEQLQAGLNDSSYYQCTAIGDHYTNLIRMNKRKTDFIKQKVKIIELSQLPKILETKERKIILRYLLNPVKLLKHNSVQFSKTTLSGEPFFQKCIDLKQIIQIQHDLLILSSGFQIQDFEHQPYKSNKIPNSNGCLTKDNQKLQIGKYAVGWCKNGPKGVIDETLLSCEQTFNNIRIHIKNQMIQQKSVQNLKTLQTNQIDFNKYKLLRDLELKRGNQAKFIKKKLTYDQIKSFYGI